MKKILVVDDEYEIRRVLVEILNEKGFEPFQAGDGKTALEIFSRENPDAVLLDLKMPGMNGIEVMREMRKTNARLPIIMVTAFGDVPSAVEAIKLGAYDFILKPPDFDRLIITLQRAIEKYELEKAVNRLNFEVEASLEYLLGKSAAMKKIIEKIYQVAESDFSVIIQGETGSGKSFAGSIIHNLSKRSDGPFVTVDVGAIPETLIESELFGHEKGAFTGADKSKKGFFEVAHKGTIFIDELQNMSLYVQSKLLRAVEEKKIFPVGSTRPLETDVRIIVASNTDIKQDIKAKKFREDLYYRLNEFMIYIPPLRERAEDISFLAYKFYREAAAELKKQVNEIAPEAVNVLKRYPWPGNVRELRNVMRRVVLLSPTGDIKEEDVRFILEDQTQGKELEVAYDEAELFSLKEVEIAAIKKALTVTRNNKMKAASLLQIDYSTLLRKIKQYGILQ